MPVDPAKETREWKAKPAWTNVRIEGNRAIMGLGTFEGLDDYSCTLPSGVFIGKRWRRREPYVDRRDGANVWFMGEYAEHEDPAQAKIIWREIWLDGPFPGDSIQRATNALLNAWVVAGALA